MSGTVAAINDDGSKYYIDYDDDEKEVLKMSGKTWRYSSDSTVDAENVRLDGQELSSSEQRLLKDYTTVFGQKPFML